MLKAFEIVWKIIILSHYNTFFNQLLSSSCLLRYVNVVIVQKIIIKWEK